MMEIGKFSNETGITIDTLRYYDKIRLLVPKRINNRRCYSVEDRVKIQLILKLKKLDFSLDDIKILFKLEDSISDNYELKNEDRDNIHSCLDMIEGKYKEIIKKEQDIILIKYALEKMMNKTNRLLETGKFE